VMSLPCCKVTSPLNIVANGFVDIISALVLALNIIMNI